MKLDLTKKIIIQVSALSLVTLIILLGIFWPTLSYIKKTSDESYKLRVFLEEKYEQSLRSHITRKKLEEIKNSASDFYPFLFKPGDEFKLITYLETLSAKYKLTQTIANSNLDKISKNRIVSISLDLSGNYNDTLKYIAELESSNYFLYISNLRLLPAYTRAGDATQTANLSITIELYVNQ